jgi:hypothetical protein
VYVNGDSIGSQDCETILDDIGEYILIGAEEISNPSHNIVNGSLNDYRIYDHCLSAGEIKELA